MEEIYKLAKRGGYEGRLYAPSVGAELLDRNFWQALFPKESFYIACDFGNCPEKDNCKCAWNWKDYWHAFIDHLAEGKDIDSFFEKLLNLEK